MPGARAVSVCPETPHCPSEPHLCAAAAVHLVDRLVQSGRNAAVVSTVTAMEILVQPLKVAPKSAAHVHAFLTHTPNLSLLSIDIHVAQEAASLRASYGFKTPDALIIATGLVGQVGHLITNDAAWQKKLAPMKGRINVTELTLYS